MKVYSKTGDKGMTSLAGGKRSQGDATFVNMRRSLRSELRDVQLSEWVATKESEAIIKSLSD